MSEANREEMLWRKAWDSGASEAERTGCFIAYHRIIMKRIQAGEPPPRYPERSAEEDGDEEEIDLSRVIANGIAFAESLGLFSTPPKRRP